MTSFRQIQANRRNALKSTAPLAKKANSNPAAMPCATASRPRL